MNDQNKQKTSFDISESSMSNQNGFRSQMESFSKRRKLTDQFKTSKYSMVSSYNNGNSPQSCFGHSKKLSNESFISDLYHDSDSGTSSFIRNASFNSNLCNSFSSKSEKVFSDINLSPGISKFSDNINADKMSNSTSQSQQSLIINQMPISLQTINNYIDLDDDILNSEMKQFLLQTLQKSKTINKFYQNLITYFSNESEFIPFFNDSFSNQQEQFMLNSIPSTTQIQGSNTNIFTFNMNSNNSFFNINNYQTNYSEQIINNEETDFQIITGTNSYMGLNVVTALSSIVFKIKPRNFRISIILTFDYYMTPFIFLLFIIRCYFIPFPLGMNDSEKDEFLKRKEEISVNIWQIIRDYIDLRGNEFLQSNSTSLLLLLFFKQVSNNNNNQKSKEIRQYDILLEKLKFKYTQYEISKYSQKKVQNNDSIPIPVVKTSTVKNIKNMQKTALEIVIFDPKSLLLYEDQVIIEVLCSIDSKWFIKLNLTNLLKTKKTNLQNKDYKNSFLTKYSNRFNYIVYWLAYQVISQKSIDIRNSYIKKYLNLLRLCHEKLNFASLHIIQTCIYKIRIFMPETWKHFEEEYLNKQKAFCKYELKLYDQLFNDKYEGYQKEMLKFQNQRIYNYIPCINPYLQDINIYENKLQQYQKKNNQINPNSTSSPSKQFQLQQQSILPWVMYEKVSECLYKLYLAQKGCERQYQNSSIVKDYKDSNNDKLKVYTLFKKKCYLDINQILNTQNIEIFEMEPFLLDQARLIDV